MDDSANSKMYLAFWQSLTRIETYKWDSATDSPVDDNVPDGEYIVMVTDDVTDAENWGVLLVTIKDNVLSIDKNVSPPGSIYKHYEPTVNWLTVSALNKLVEDCSQQHPSTGYGVYLRTHPVPEWGPLVSDPEDDRDDSTGEAYYMSTYKQS